MPLPFNYDDLLEQFEPRFVWRGEDYFEQGRVEDLNLTRNGHVLSGLVQGRGRRPYEVHVVVRGSRTGPIIDGYCSCPVRHGCKHIVALLVAALERKESVSTMPAPGPGAAVETWFRELDQALQPLPSRDAYPPNVNQRLLYVLRVRDYERASVLDIDFQVVRRLKAGGYGKATGYNPENLFNYGAPGYLLESDQDILRRLRARHIVEFVPTNRLTGKGSGELLSLLLATGRCHWQDKDQPPLAPGKTRDAQPVWVIDEAGVQRLEIHTSPPATRILPTSPPWYLDLENGQCGPLTLELPEALHDSILQAPAVPPEQVQAVRKKLKALPVPAPEVLKVRNKPAVRPQPVLNLCTQAVLLGASYWSPGKEIRLPVARLTVDYGGHEIDPADPRPELRWLEENVAFRQPRDRRTEGESLARLKSLGFVPLHGVLPPAAEVPSNAFVWDEDEQDEPDAWVEFILETAPALRADGWRIETAEDFPYHMAEVQEWTLDLDDNPEQQWFDLDLGIIVDGRRLSLLPILVDAIRQFPGELTPAALAQLPGGHRMLVPLEDGRILPLPSERVAAILGVLVELFDPDSLSAEGRLHLPEWRAAELAELDAGTEQAARMRWLGGERLQSLGERLRGFEGIQPVAVPKDFGTKLRPYQQDGLNWLQFLRDYGLNGVLADDMGLGKTVQALAHLMAERAAGRLDRPSLVVAPTSLMYNWRHEAQRFAPELRVLTLHGPDRKEHFASVAEHDLVLTTYPLLSRDEAILAAQPFHLVILDEAQFIKNPKAKATRVAHALEARHRLCLTGTPLENHLGELWSIFHFVMPGLLGDERQFRRLFRTPIEKQGDGERGARLARRVAPFLLRRTKEEVAGDLPPKTEIVRSVPLEGAQRDLYESIRLAMHDKVRRAIDQKGVARSQIVILDALLKLRQVCCDPRLLKMAAAKKARHSAKLEMLMELLPELLEERRRILLFSQFTSMLGLIEAELEARGIDYVKLTGRTRDRATPIQRFQNGEVALFLISLKAGGTGLNLTAADTVIHYDPWWNPAVEAQATDRAHRIGQDKPVFVYKLLTEGTVEERIQALQAHKRQLADSLFEGAGKGKLPGADDLEELFRPL